MVIEVRTYRQEHSESLSSLHLGGQGQLTVMYISWMVVEHDKFDSSFQKLTSINRWNIKIRQVKWNVPVAKLSLKNIQ